MAENHHVHEQREPRVAAPKQQKNEQFDFVKSESTSSCLPNAGHLLKHGLTSKDIIDIERDPYGVQHLQAYLKQDNKDILQGLQECRGISHRF